MKPFHPSLSLPASRRPLLLCLLLWLAMIALHQDAWLWDDNNKQYLDALSGIAVCGLGHAHPAVHSAICKQSGKLLHTSNIYRIAVQEQLADRLIEKSGMDNVFFCNSGAEACEGAIKLVRKYHFANTAIFA